MRRGNLPSLSCKSTDKYLLPYPSHFSEAEKSIPLDHIRCDMAHVSDKTRHELKVCDGVQVIYWAEKECGCNWMKKKGS